ncbi:hypothetical protein IPM62_01445 [Candidatus Woesebacteria bacterium]|nr:MAG: hypothetical protein IPM62_01445 [Candidatus Woesebacteria bacterium]
MKIFLALLFIFFPLIAPLSVNAQAVGDCKCSKVVDAIENAKKYEYIFSGSVEKIIESGSEHVVSFKLIKSYKGYLNESFNVYTSNEEAKCGYKFVKGREYFVFASLDGQGRIVTGKCSQNEFLEEAGDDVAAIAGRKIASETKDKFTKTASNSMGPLSETTPAMTVVVLSAAAVLILGVGVGMTGVPNERKKKKSD